MSAMPTYKPPFPYFGGKARIAAEVWKRFGSDCRSYVEPFFGSGAVLFSRPDGFSGVEAVNDADGLACNFWRAVQADPEAVAYHADWPVIESDLHARHVWLVGQKESLQGRQEGDPDHYDAKIAGWWAWGLSAWIGHGWCSGNGPWHVVEDEDGHPVLRKTDGGTGRGVNRQLPHLGDAGKGVNRPNTDLLDYLTTLSARLRGVRVACGDWSRLCKSKIAAGSPNHRPIAVFLDPPYADTAGRDGRLYRVDSQSVAHDVREWAIAHGDDPEYRIALCGFEGEHEMPDSWEVAESVKHLGYGGQAKDGYTNRERERVWYSPHCVKPGCASPLLLRADA